MKNAPRWLRVAATILAALAIAATTVATSLDSGDKTPPPDSGRSSWGAAPAATPSPAPLAGSEHTGLAEPGDRDLGTLRGAPPAIPGDTLPGCETRFNTHNFSSRNGTPVREISAHYTVSRNVKGWADVNANWAFLNAPSTQASATAIIDDEGNCVYSVPVRYKAWTEAGGNSFTAGIEFVAMGDEGRLSPAALAEGGRVIAAIAARMHIKLQLGDVTGCEPRREGVVDHAMYGPCGGGHHDMRPLYGTHVPPRPAEDTVALGPLIAAAKAASSPLATLTSGERTAADTLTLERKVAARHGGWAKIDPGHLARAVLAKGALRRANVRLHAAAAKSGWDRADRRARHALIHRLL